MNAYSAILGALVLLHPVTAQSVVPPDTGVDTSAARQSNPVPVTARYLLRFAEPGVLYYGGEVAGLRATAPSTKDSRKLDRNAPDVEAYRAHVKTLIDERTDELSVMLGRQLQVDFHYDVTHVGMALWLTEKEAERVAALSYVQSIEREQVYQLETDFGPRWIGSETIWDGSAVPGGIGTRGQGMVAGVVDSGTQTDHPSFAPMGAECGFGSPTTKLLSAANCLNAVVGNPSECSSTDVNDPFAATGGHGIHVASTVVGNRLLPGAVTPSPDRPMSGVAPCAQVRSYRACGESGCPGAPIQAAIQAAILDGVDAINYSISGGQSPWTDFDRLFLDAVNADIFVAASGGNTRTATPDPFANVNHRGPWVMTVAMSTHDRGAQPGTALVNLTGPTPVPPGTTNITFTPSSSPALTTTLNAPMRLPVPPTGEPTNFQGCDAAPAGLYTGAIALVSRGTCSFAIKSQNASAAGAVALVVYNNAAGTIAMGALEGTTIPAVMIPQSAGEAMRDFIIANAATPTLAELIPFVAGSNPALADILSGGSLTGPNNSFDVTKPDITGPGVSIYAATNPANGNYTLLTGTSMSSPHVAGSALLLRALRPDLTVMEIRSMMMLSGNNSIGRKPNGTTPWDPDDVGNGRIDLAAAINSALVMDESYARFLAANPATGGQPRNLNLPSARHSTCTSTCSWTRRVRNATDEIQDFSASASSTSFGLTVLPASFDLLPGDVLFRHQMEVPTEPVSSFQDLTITADTSAMAAGTALRFGRVTIDPVTSGLSDALITVSVRKP